MNRTLSGVTFAPRLFFCKQFANFFSVINFFVEIIMNDSNKANNIYRKKCFNQFSPTNLLYSETGIVNAPFPKSHLQCQGQ